MTYVAPSAISGKGVFADEPIRKGDEVATWFYVVTPEIKKGHRLWEYLVDTPEGDAIILGDGNFLNHSSEPNCELRFDGDEKVTLVALEDCDPDTELTIRYKEIWWTVPITVPAVNVGALRDQRDQLLRILTDSYICDVLSEKSREHLNGLIGLLDGMLDIAEGYA